MKNMLCLSFTIKEMSGKDLTHQIKLQGCIWTLKSSSGGERDIGGYYDGCHEKAVMKEW